MTDQTKTPRIVYNKESKKYLRFDNADTVYISEVNEPKMATIFHPEYGVTDEEIIEMAVNGDWNETYTGYQEDYKQKIREKLVVLCVKVIVEIKE